MFQPTNMTWVTVVSIFQILKLNILVVMVKIAFVICPPIFMVRSNISPNLIEAYSFYPRALFSMLLRSFPLIE